MQSATAYGKTSIGVLDSVRLHKIKSVNHTYRSERVFCSQTYLLSTPARLTIQKDIAPKFLEVSTKFLAVKAERIQLDGGAEVHARIDKLLSKARENLSGAPAYRYCCRAKLFDRADINKQLAGYANPSSISDPRQV